MAAVQTDMITCVGGWGVVIDPIALFIYLFIFCVNLSVFEVSLCAKSRLIIDLMLFIKQQTTMFLPKATFLAIMNFNHIHAKQSKGLEIVISV